jgi:hypothetical protein
MGNGDQTLSHCNLYTDLLHSVGIYLEDVKTRAYADNPDMLNAAYTLPLFQLVISQFSHLYFPEILGMTLQLEWTVLSLKPIIKLYKKFGLNPQFYEMHVGIDNAATGHGAKAKEAVKLYLDRVREESGEQEVQEQWRRIWNGYVAFETTGDWFEDFRFMIRNPASPREKIVAMINRKRPRAQLNHGIRKVGDNLLNDWFEDPEALLDELVKAGYFIPGDPDNSPFFKLLTFTGPMYKVFTEKEIKLWGDWVRSLTAKPPSPVDPGQAMIMLIDTMRERQKNSATHKVVTLLGPDPDHAGGEVPHPVAWWFENRPSRDLMLALKNRSNEWIVPGDVGRSRFVSELLHGDNAMARALSNNIPGTNKTGLEIATEWITANCPSPQEVSPAREARVAEWAMPIGDARIAWPAPPSLSGVMPIRRRRRVFGMGAVH